MKKDFISVRVIPNLFRNPVGYCTHNGVLKQVQHDSGGIGDDTAEIDTYPNEMYSRRKKEIKIWQMQ